MYAAMPPEDKGSIRSDGEITVSLSTTARDDERKDIRLIRTLHLVQMQCCYQHIIPIIHLHLSPTGHCTGTIKLEFAMGRPSSSLHYNWIAVKCASLT